MTPNNNYTIMGILNVTPDSFSDKGKYQNANNAISHAFEMISQGASIIDVGGESTRPNATAIDDATEWGRVCEVLKSLSMETRVSVDTYRLATMEKALDLGVKIINNVAHMTQNNNEVFELIKKYNAEIIVTHNSRGRDLLNNNIVDDVEKYFMDKITLAHSCGIKNENIILDVGIGFGKTVQQNLLLIKNLDKLIAKFSNQFLLGTSKKSFLSKIIDSNDDKLLTDATIATTVIGYQRGCRMFRVHDILPNISALKIAKEIYG